MSKSKDKRLPWDARAADVLAGRTKLDAVDLISLVNEVNPTGRGRDARETAVRYSLKARLESLLVARFPDAIEVAPDPDNEGVVSIRHRTHRQAACHAVLDALDEGARSWVQRTLDLAASGGADDPESAPARAARVASDAGDDDEDPSQPDALLGAAERAEEAYDFERAERLYGLAFRAQRDARSAQALLRFLVDAMAADAAALALSDELPAEVRAHPGVRVLLGVAAARSGDEARAAASVTGVEDPRAAEVLALVARSALARGDADAAALRLRDAEAVDPGHPDLRALGEELSKLRQEQRAPDEAELATLISAGRAAEALAKAEAILARWPESEVARRAARSLEARRQADEGRRLLAEADALHARGDAASALGLYQRALSVKLGDEDLGRARRMVERIVAEEREREAARRAERVATSVGAADKQERARGLAAYAELDEGIRGRVRSRAGAPVLEWVDAMIRAGVRPKATLDAALALERAAALPPAEAAAVLALLAPHDRAIEGVPFARRLAGEARERVAGERRRHALADLQAAEEALAAGEVERSRGLLDRAARELDHTHSEDRARADALSARLAAHVEQHQLEKRFERARATFRWAEAKRTAEAIAVSISHPGGRPGAPSDEPARARWSEVARTLMDEVRRELRLRIYDLEGGTEISRGSYLTIYPPTIPAYVDLRRGVCILPAAGGREVFIREFSLETGRLVRCAHLYSPASLDEPSVEVSGDTLMMMGGGNGVLELSLATLEPERFTRLRDPNNMERRLTTATSAAPGGRFLWVMMDEDGDAASVFDLERGRVVRELGHIDSFETMRGVSPPKVAVVRSAEDGWDNVLSLHEPGGAQISRHDFGEGRVEVAAPHPLGDGLFVVFSESKYANGSSTTTNRWVEVMPDGEHRRAEVIPDEFAPYARGVAACARDLGMVFFSFRSKDEKDVCLALARDPALPAGVGCLRIAYRFFLPYRYVLVQDPEGRRVYLVGEHDGGIDVLPLGPEPPAIPDRAPSPAITFPLTKLWDCTEPNVLGMNTRSRKWFMEFKWHRVEEIRALSGAIEAEHDGDRTALLELFWALALSNDAGGAGALSEKLVARYPGDAEIIQASWAALAVQRRWAGLVELLGPPPDASVPEPVRQHRHHLLAAAHLALGDVDKAIVHLQEGRGLAGKCNLQPLGALCAAVGGPRTLAEPHAQIPGVAVPPDLGRTVAAIETLIGIVRSADACLARGDHAGVLPLYERMLPWELREAQSMARLAEAHLALPARTDPERLRKSLAVAFFADSLNENRVGFRSELIVPGATWPDERLDAVAAKAKAWLAKPDD